jgi:hypothetical protein
VKPLKTLTYATSCDCAKGVVEFNSSEKGSRTQARFFLEEVFLRLAAFFVRLLPSLPNDRTKALTTASAAAAAAAFAAALAARETSDRALPIKLFFFAIAFPLIG